MITLLKLESIEGVVEILKNFNPLIKRLEPLLSFNHDSESMTWCSERNMEEISHVRLTTIIVPSSVDKSLLNDNCNYILSDSPRRLFSIIIKRFFYKEEEPSISKTAVIHSSVKIGDNVWIGENVVIEHGSIIGNNVKIDHNTVIKRNTVIGNNSVLGCNCSIGGNGAGFEKNVDGYYELIPHIGNVVLKENVEIGQNCCIDRAVLGSTVIGFNVKIDNHVHIAHGVIIGENSILTANSMVAGSTQLGKDVWVGPSSSLMNKINVGDGAFIGLGAVVIRSVESGHIMVGNPARNIKK